jgi:predicted SAM-dependent methyltransferase
MADGVYLNLGCGGQIPFGWINVDKPQTESTWEAIKRQKDDFHRVHPVMYGDLTDPWPWEDGSVDGIVMHHVLDLLADEGVSHACREAHRVLRPNGVLRISVADIDAAIWQAQHGQWNWFPEPQYDPDTDTIHSPGRFNAETTLGFFITQGGARKQHFTIASLMQKLIGYLFDVRAAEYQWTTGEDRKITELDSREDESFFVEAFK